MVCRGQAVPEWKLKETFKVFRLLMGAFEQMNRQLHALQEKAWVADTKDVDIFIKTWLYICELGMEILKNRSACDTWADDVKDFGSKNLCRLQRAIGKLCNIHFQVGILIRFAFSRRTRFMLSESTLVITPVKLDALTNKQPMPSTRNGWRKVRDGILDRQELVLDGLPQKVRETESKIIDKALARQGSLVKHCECLVVAHLLRHNSPSPFPYIGCSKLSCKSCFLWLQAVGEVTNCKFNTKSSHNKWYPFWSSPALAKYKDKSKIDNSFLGKVESELCEELKTSDSVRPRAYSDSSNSSEECKATMKLEDKAGMQMMGESPMEFIFGNV